MKIAIFIISLLLIVSSALAYEETAETKEQEIIFKAFFYIGIAVFFFGYFMK